MNSGLILSPRYRLDDELPWLEGIDPARRYWLAVNSRQRHTVAIPGLMATDEAEFKTSLRQFLALQPGDTMAVERAAETLLIRCIGANCYAIDCDTVWHLFDRETLQSLLMTAHPDWKCAVRDMELGRRSLAMAFEQSVAA